MTKKTEEDLKKRLETTRTALARIAKKGKAAEVRAARKQFKRAGRKLLSWRHANKKAERSRKQPAKSAEG